MLRIPGSPEKPQYNSVKVYLSELAKDIAEMVVNPVKMERFREQLTIYANLWKQWTTFDEADRQGCWVPSMGRPECIFNIFSRSYNPLKDSGKEAKRLAGSYALCALIHDSQLPHLDKINTDIVRIEAIEETLSSPRNTLDDRIVGNWNSGPDVREIYLIEEFFNRVKVDLRELCNSEKNKLTQAYIEEQIQNANELSDTEFIELTSKKFEQRAKRVLSTDETWHDLDRSLKGWFDNVIGRLKKSGFTENDIALLKYLYKNLLHYARGINIKSFRGFPDSRIAELAYNTAFELAEKFKRIDLVNRNYKPKKGSFKAQQKLALDEANKLAADATQNPNKDIFLLYRYATQALANAVTIAKMTRIKERLPVEQFVANQVRLFEYIKQIESYPNITNIFESWPANPGITFAWLAGQNALDVAIKFAQMISTAVIVSRNETAFRGATSYDNLIVCPKPDPAFEKWQDRTIKELLTHQIPKPDIWPSIADIHHEYQSLLYKLQDEYKRALNVENRNDSREGGARQKNMKYDVFICHASEDKESFVEPLANALKKAGIKVWYDRFEFKLGDSLRSKIDEGLANSRYGVVILSSFFFNKEWPKTELDALVSRQNEDGKKVILPIWHRVGVEEVRKFSPILASKLAAQSSESLESIVVQIENVLNENSTREKPDKDNREPVETEPDTKRELGEMSKWYQNRTIQAALIGAFTLILVSCVGWYISHKSGEANNIFAYISKDGAILRRNHFPWEIRKSNDQDGNILYTIVDRRGDATAISVVPDNPKYTVYQSSGGMVIKFTCAEEKISDFTIKVKY